MERRVKRRSSELLERGFAIVPNLIPPERLTRIAAAYDLAVAEARPPEARVGRTTIRVHGVANRGAELAGLSVSPLILDACARVMRAPYELSSFLARTVLPHAEAQPLHVDMAADGDAWPMLGFIVMVDEFTADNGATRFVPRSHHSRAVPEETDTVPVCGPAGSVILYSGSVWHGHSANRTARPRRSLQGAYVRGAGVPPARVGRPGRR